MRRSTFVAAAILLLLRSVPVLSQADELWQRAVAFMALQPRLGPQQVVSRFELLKSDGTVDHSREVHLRVTYDDSGNAQTEITKVLEDGQDVTAQAKERQARSQGSGKGRSSNLQFGLGPFDPEAQQRVRVQSLGQTKVIGGRTCVGYHFEEDQGEKGKTRGEAWLDAATAAPTCVVVEPDPLPKRVKEMRTTLLYGQDPNGHWVTREMIVEGKASFLLMKKGFRNVMQFAEFRELPPAAKR